MSNLDVNEFSQKYIEHFSVLKQYKPELFYVEDNLLDEIKVNGEIRSGEKVRRYNFVMSDNLLDNKNICKYVYLRNYRDRIVDYISNNYYFYDYYHKSLLNTQNLKYNLFFPITVDVKRLEILSVFFDNPIEIFLNYQCNDGALSNTNFIFDAAIKHDNSFTFINLKFLEQSFDLIDPEPLYLAKWNGERNELSNVNMDYVRVKYRLINKLVDGIFSFDSFIDNYDLLVGLYNTFFSLNEGSNTIFHTKNNTYVIMLLKENESLIKKINNLISVLKVEYKDRVRIEFLNDFVSGVFKISKESRNYRMVSHFRELKKFYLL